MATFLRFFILALPPLLGVTSYAGPAVLYALVLVLLMLASTLLARLTKEKLSETMFFWVLVGQATVLMTIIDLLVTWLAPSVRSAWGIYFNLLALSPLLLVLPVERRIPGRTAFLLVALISVMGILREGLGLGTLSLIPGSLSWSLPFLSTHPLAIFSTMAGGFFLLSASLVIARILQPVLPVLLLEPDEIGARTAPVPDVAIPEKAFVERRQKPRLSDHEAWGESLEDVMSPLPQDKSVGKKRVLVIGSGNGELVYYLAMLGLEAQKQTKSFQFRIRGVDHFSTRVETAVRGIYRDNALSFIPERLQNTWLTRGKDEDRNLLRVSNEPRLHIQFEVADLHTGALYFPQPSHLTVVNQGVEHGSDERKAQFFSQVCDNLLPGGALVILGPFRRESLPEGMKRTGNTVFRKT